jgi:hypothetical protein
LLTSDGASALETSSGAGIDTGNGNFEVEKNKNINLLVQLKAETEGGASATKKMVISNCVKASSIGFDNSVSEKEFLIDKDSSRTSDSAAMTNQ